MSSKLLSVRTTVACVALMAPTLLPVRLFRYAIYTEYGSGAWPRGASTVSPRVECSMKQVTTLWQTVLWMHSSISFIVTFSIYAHLLSNNTNKLSTKLCITSSFCHLNPRLCVCVCVRVRVRCFHREDSLAACEGCCLASFRAIFMAHADGYACR
jgi:hypothetical protein